VPPAFALKISPFTADMAPSGPRATLDYVLENNSPNPTAVQVSIVRREQVEDGSETLTAADDEFLVFPAQFILLPKEKRTVGLQWLGPVNPEKELAYRLIAEQLPVDLGRPGVKDNLTLLVKYLTAVYIVPPRIHSNPATDLVVQRAEPSRDRRGRQTMDVYVANHGLAHIQLRNVQLTVKSSDDGKTVTLPSQRLTGSMLG
jgi:fimbrial chaperone protein